MASIRGPVVPGGPLRETLRRSEQTGQQAGDYDYIVIGSGAGGGPLAANLAKAGFQVLLLEAGGDAACGSELGRLMYEVPIFHGLSTEFPECQWDYFVEHYSDPDRQKLDSKIVTADPANPGKSVNGVWYPRAGTLGGCTAHNAMITATPQNVDWDSIATLTGDATWRSERMNEYFARLENCTYRPKPGSLKYNALGVIWSLWAGLRLRSDWRDWAHGHGFSGWLTTSESDPRQLLRDKSLLKQVFNAVKISIESGLGNPLLSIFTKLDPNDSRNAIDMKEGLALTPMAVAKGKRNGPRDFLLRTQSETNKLNIQLHSLATRILFEGRRAVGVEFVQGSHLYEADPASRRPNAPKPELKKQQVLARREVILCAGAFNSPQLLKLSGIGPAEELKRFGIEPILDSPGVGENLQDRYEVGVIASFDQPFALLGGASFGPPIEGEEEEKAFIEWKQGKGLYAGNGVLIGLMKRSDPRRPEPDLYIFGLPGYFKGYSPGYSKLFERDKNKFTWAILKAYTRNSAGRVSLQSNDPTKWPRIEFRYFTEGNDTMGEDLNAMVEGVQFVRRMNKRLGAHDEECPGPAYTSDEQLREFIKNEAWGHHASCTNRIGADGDDMAVLDSRFRVRGVERLRVVDASIFPKIPGYFIVTAIYMASEKASDVIREDAL